jgi:hypothetical protein
MYVFSYCVSCETDILKVFYFIRTILSILLITHSLMNCPSVKGFELDVIKCECITCFHCCLIYLTNRLENILLLIKTLFKFIFSNFLYKQIIFFLVDIMVMFNIVIFAKEWLLDYIWGKQHYYLLDGEYTKKSNFFWNRHFSSVLLLFFPQSEPPL